jgi:periplasmic divalent cation tolerance protein
MTDAILIYVTAEDYDAAQMLASHLLERNLVACANIFQPHTAVYRWEGYVEAEPETAMLLKSTKGCYQAIEDEIVRVHGYDCPCVVSCHIDQGFTPFLEWIGEECDGNNRNKV